jgi:hypothetical protein
VKYLIILFLLGSYLLSDQNYKLKPLGKIQLRYQDKLKVHSPFGEAFYQTNQTKINDTILGGTFGIRTLYDSFTLDTLVYGERKRHDQNINDILYLGELNIQKQFDKHSIKIGRQSYSTQLVDQNYRITQNSYEGIKYKYQAQDFEFQTFYFYKVVSSTMANNIPYNHKYGFLGYGMGYNTDHFEDISTHLINKKLSTKGVLHFLAKYGEKSNYISFENLYIDNFFNTSNLTLAYNINNFYIKLGMLFQKSVGDKHMENYIEVSERYKNLEAKHYQMQLMYKKNDFSFQYSIAHTPYDEDNIYNGTFYSPFANKASWLYGMDTNHANVADTTSQTIRAIYRSLKLYKVPLVLAAGYIKYHIGPHNGLTPISLDTSERYYHITGYFSKNLSATLQYSHSKNYDPLREKITTTKVFLTYQF